MKMQEYEPFLLSPAGKDYLWGGNRLNTEYGKNIDLSPLAETWECSTHPDGPSVVRSGMFRGLPLPQVIREHPEILGTKYEKTGELPILIKFIDAEKDLSVQVHPSDEYAAANENGQRGKTEMWYVADAAPGACLVCGLSRKTDAGAFREMAENGTLDDCLNRVSVRRGDSFFIKPGTVHAIGAGALIAEIQENSNITYRIYDYNRTDKNGNRRPLHLDKAMDVAILDAAEPIKKSGAQPDGGQICSCGYFTVDRIVLHGETAEIARDSRSFRVLLCLGGQASADGLVFGKGDCVFVPAGNKAVKITGDAEILQTVC